MKSSGCFRQALILILVTSLFFLASCSKNPVTQVKVNDFNSLASQFSEPAAEYTTSPFFVWNAEITNDEIDKDLESFKNAGSSQVFIHPRPGLITEYLSDDWFKLFGHAVEKGKELGMRIWIYDENSYPSGFGGGHVPDEMPESYNQGQGLKMTRTDVLPDSLEKYYLCLKEENGKFRDITSSAAGEKGKKGSYFLFAKTYNEKSDWYGGFSYVDLLYPGVTQKFIEVTMKGYEKYLGAEFGQTIPGTFTDEPQIESPGGIRWTPDLFDVFFKRWNYDLKTQLPSLFEETGDWKKVRHNYTQTLLQLFVDRWAKPWNSYCATHNLSFTGHYWEHEWPNMRPGGDNMAMYAWSQIPAIDMLFNRWDDSTTKAQFGNIRSVKELASAANQTGRQRKLSETYGGSGWDLTFADMKRNGDWEFALGVNLMNQHLTYFTMAGARKYDYPPTFDYHEPWWNDYKYLNTHYARLSLALSAGLQRNEILILEPTTTCWLYDSYTNPNPLAEKTGQAFQTFITTLEKSQVEYDLGSENIIKDMGRVSGDKFKVGNATYSTVVIPPMVENLDRTTFSLIKRFVAEGGNLITFSSPALIDGSPDVGLTNFFREAGSRITVVEKLTPENIQKLFSAEKIRFENLKGGDLYHHRRVLSDGQLLFLANSDLINEASGSISTRGRSVLEMNTLTGKINVYPAKVNGDEITIDYSLPPAGSLLLFVGNNYRADYESVQANTNYLAVKQILPTRVIRDKDNVVIIDFCDLELGKDVFRDLHTYTAADIVYKFYGFKNGNPWNTSVQFRRNIVDRDTFKTGTGFTTNYHFNISAKFDCKDIQAVVERPGLWKVSINGKPLDAEKGKWWVDRSFGVFSIGKEIKTGDNILTLEAAPMKLNAEIEPVYILGNFSSVPGVKGWSITEPATSLDFSSWKMQGLPFYSWGVKYSQEFSLDNTKGSWEVALGKWNGTVAEVTVNGKPATVIAFPPYTCNITGLLSPGANKIEVKVIGSLRNLLGPHHRNEKPGLVTPWSWRFVESYPSGKDYSLVDYGLTDDFKLLHSVN